MKRKHIVLVHLLFWFYMLNQMLFPLYINKQEAHYFEDAILSLVLNLITFYVIYFSFPHLLDIKRKIFSILIGVGIIFAISGFKYVADIFICKNLIHFSDKEMGDLNLWFYNELRLTIIYGIYSILIRFAIDWFKSQKLKAELINQNQASELALLRSQVNPHFFFNTLNNVYSLVYKKSDDAPAALMKLSSIMRYMLYDATTDKVLLEKEVEYLQSFIELQKLRLRQKEVVEFSLEGNLNGKTIAPMLLIPFVENAFKHGSKRDIHPLIKIHLKVDLHQITFEISNPVQKTGGLPADTAKGIGLHNIRRRLELLYPGRYILDIKEENELFNVNLIIRD